MSVPKSVMRANAMMPMFRLYANAGALLMLAMKRVQPNQRLKMPSSAGATTMCAKRIHLSAKMGKWVLLVPKAKFAIAQEAIQWKVPTANAEYFYVVHFFKYSKNPRL